MSTDEILEIISFIKAKATDSDGINIDHIKLSLQHMLPYITHITNLRITETVVPAAWKIANLIHIPNKKI